MPSFGARIAIALQAAVRTPVSPARLGFLRMAFGALMVLAVVRFFANGWIDEFYTLPELNLPFVPGLRPWNRFGMHLHFFLMGLAAFFVMLGRLYRPALALFLILFVYVELLDKTTYLNHYYLVTLLGILLLIAPADRAFVVGKRPGQKGTIAFGWLLAFRIQVGLVYFFAGVAKLNPDWLLHGQPLLIWLKANSDLPIIGPLLAQQPTALAASWAGAVFDLTVPFFLCFRRTRPFAFLAVVGFHLVTWKLFYLGLFPWIMIVSATVFFRPEMSHAPIAPQRPASRTNMTAAVVVLHLLVQLILPLRSFLYEGYGLWHEQGFRFSWKVMLIEKAGLARFIVETEDGRELLSYPEDHLSVRQAKMMVTQPDMIVQYAQILADIYRDKGVHVRAVRVDSWVALNGRGSQRFLPNDLNLLSVPVYGAGAYVLPLAGNSNLRAAWRPGGSR